MQKVEVQFQWFALTSNHITIFRERTGLFIGHFQLGEFYLNYEEKWVVIVDRKEIGKFQLIGRQEAAVICLTAAKQLLKIEE